MQGTPILRMMDTRVTHRGVGNLSLESI